MSGISLYLGSYSASVQGEKANLSIPRMFSAAHAPSKWGYGYPILPGSSILDSGAFSDKPEKRLSPEQALQRQFKWEERARRLWNAPEWQAYAFVSYDLLIDETWVCGVKRKQRWGIQRAEEAVQETVKGAEYLAKQRDRLSPRRLVLAAQGVDAQQYKECSELLLAQASPADIFGLGGWCIVGMMRSYMPVFWQAMHEVIPLIAQAGIKDVHIFGVMYEPVLAGLLWLTNKHGLRLSTDSGKPIQDCTWKKDEHKRQAGARRIYWRDNVEWWIQHLSAMEESQFYKEPPRSGLVRQEIMF